VRKRGITMQMNTKNVKKLLKLYKSNSKFKSSPLKQIMGGKNGTDVVVKLSLREMCIVLAYM
jgi:hypothetical protein